MSKVKVTHPTQMHQYLKGLIGRWEGVGHGTFPTIEDFRYQEVFEVTHRNQDESAVHYHQQAWILRPDGTRGADSHWESGFILLRDDGRLEILNAQESRRVEVLVGEMYSAGDSSCVIEAKSVVHAYDQRMLATRRTLEFDDQNLQYRVEMATTGVPDQQFHLAAKLTRLSA